MNWVVAMFWFVAICSLVRCNAMETHDVPCVETLDQCIKWFDDCVGRYGGERCIKELADKLDGLVMSTAFSGIGAADVAMETLLHGIQTYTHLPVAYRNAFAIEYNEDCQKELQLLGTPPEHLFGDMLGFINRSIAGVFSKFRSRWGYVDYVKWLTHPKPKKRLVQLHAQCILHPACSCPAKRADLHVAGPPYVDFSSWSNDPGGLQGPQLACLMIWIGQRMQLEEPLILHENVPGVNASPIAPLQELLSEMYIIQTCVFDSFNLGHAAHRERRITWMLHRKHVVSTPSMHWSSAIERFYRELKCSYHIYMIADEEKLNEDLAWCENRSGVGVTSLAERSQHARNICSEHKGFATEVSDPDHRWFKALTEKEQDRLVNYWLRLSGYSSSTTVCALGQDPHGRPLDNKGSKALMCLIRNTHIVWDFKHKRWLEPHELLLAQCFPVLGSSPVTCSFSRDRPNHWPRRTRNNMVHQAGNSMNVHAIGCAIVWCVMEVHMLGHSSRMLLREALKWRCGNART